MYSITDPTSYTSIADWAEWYVTYNKSTLSKSSLGSAMADSLGSDVRDDEVDSVWLELRSRQELYGTDSPIKVQGRILESRVDWTTNPVYMACLIFSVTGNVDTPGKSGKLFEELSNVAVRNYIGGQSVTCGAPYKQTVKELAALVNESYIKEYPSFRKDRNLDILAWKPFNDKRPNQLVVIVQCASGKNWRTKTTELAARAWEHYINFLSPPLRSFTLPDVISDAERFEDYGLNAGIILDRTRIYRCTYNVPLDAPLRDRLMKWCKARLKKMNNTP